MGTRTITVVIEDAEGGGFTGWVEDCPGAVSEGDTIMETFKNVADAMSK